MSNRDRNELGKLAGQVRTHLEYLRELGIDGAAEFARLDSSLNAKPVNAVDSRRTGSAGRATASPTAGAIAPSASPIPAARLADLPRLGAPRADRRPMPVSKTKPSGASKPAITAMFSDGGGASELPGAGETLAGIQESIGACTLCPLHAGRTHIVHTEGNPNARLMFVGEAPGADEDAQGRPFVGRAGQLLNKIIEAIGFRRDEVLIGNINRCRPPGNRPPTPDEVAACKPFILKEIGAVRPAVVVVLGNTAMKNLLGAKEGITKVRGIFQDFHGIKVMPTFHPAYLLRDPSKKRETWEDLKKVRDFLLQNQS